MFKFEIPEQLFEPTVRPICLKLFLIIQRASADAVADVDVGVLVDQVVDQVGASRATAYGALRELEILGLIYRIRKFGRPATCRIK